MFNLYSLPIIFDQYTKYVKAGNQFPITRLNEIKSLIDLHASVVFLHENFLKIDLDSLIRLLERDELFIREKDVYYACMNWMNEYLKRKGEKINLSNKFDLFNQIKHLIRFPLMSEEQFFNSVRIKKFPFEHDIELENCPAKSGLFSEKELNEFRKWYASKENNFLSVNYNMNRRAKLNIGKLHLQRKKHEDFHFNFYTRIDNSFYPNNDDAESKLSDGSDKKTLDELHRENKFRKMVTKLRAENLKCDFNSIRVFRIHAICHPQNWINGKLFFITLLLQQYHAQIVKVLMYFCSELF